MAAVVDHSDSRRQQRWQSQAVGVGREHPSKAMSTAIDDGEAQQRLHGRKGDTTGLGGRPKRIRGESNHSYTSFMKLLMILMTTIVFFVRKKSSNTKTHSRKSTIQR